MVDIYDGKMQIVVKYVCCGLLGLIFQLIGMFGCDVWCLVGVVVVGLDSEVSEFLWQFERVLLVLVFV